MFSIQCLVFSTEWLGMSVWYSVFTIQCLVLFPLPGFLLDTTADKSVLPTA